MDYRRIYDSWYARHPLGSLCQDLKIGYVHLRRCLSCKYRRFRFRPHSCRRIQRRPRSCWCTHGINGLCHRNRRRINRSKYHVHVWIKILLTEIYQKTKTYRLSCNHHKSLYVFYLSSAYSVSRILSTTLSFFPKQNATFGTTAPSMRSTGNIRSIGVMIK